MALQSNVYFVGRMGNVVGSTWMGIPYFRYQPDHINQSKASKQSGINLGKASKIGAGLRSVFAPVLPQPKDKDMQNDFTGVIKKWLQTKPFEGPLPTVNLPFINDFDFNSRALIHGAFRVPLMLQTNAEDQLTIHMPAFVPKEKIAAPGHTQKVNIHMIAATYSIKEFANVDSYRNMLAIPYNNDTIPEQMFTLPYALPNGSITTILVALQYLVMRKGQESIATDIRWLPCGIVGGWVC